MYSYKFDWHFCSKQYLIGKLRFLDSLKIKQVMQKVALHNHFIL